MLTLNILCIRHTGYFTLLCKSMYGIHVLIQTLNREISYNSIHEILLTGRKKRFGLKKMINFKIGNSPRYKHFERMGYFLILYKIYNRN